MPRCSINSTTFDSLPDVATCLFVTTAIVASLSCHLHSLGAQKPADLRAYAQASTGQRTFDAAVDKMRQSTDASQVPAAKALANELIEAKTDYLQDLHQAQQTQARQGNRAGAQAISDVIDNANAFTFDALTKEVPNGGNTSETLASLPQALAAHRKFSNAIKIVRQRHQPFIASHIEGKQRALDFLKKVYVDMLRNIKFDLTKKGNLNEAAVIIYEIDRAESLLVLELVGGIEPTAATSTASSTPAVKPNTPTTTPGTPSPNFPVSPIAAQSAKIQVREMKAEPLVQSEEGWRIIPEFLLKNRAMVYGGIARGKPGRVADIEVLESGKLLVACYYGYEGNNSGGWVETRWKKKDFIDNGWEFFDDSQEMGRLIQKKDRKYLLFSKDVTKGEKLSLQCNKYGAPRPIVFR